MKKLVKVFLVEDEEILRKGLVLTTDWASMDTMVIGEACDGINGEQLALKLQPDLIITDIAMPGKDGLEMISDLYKIMPDTEFIIISGHADFMYAKKALDFGVKGYILKPIDMKEFYSVVRKAVENVLQRRQEQVQVDKPVEHTTSYYSDAVQQAIDYRDTYVSEIKTIISKHYAESLNIVDIAQNMEISERSLSRLFKEKMGYTILEYLTQIRIKQAMLFLQEKERQVNEVAELVGYKDYRYFCRVFKTYVGITPFEYKKGGSKS